jgi:DNA-binding GntR family transcriptional regulator
MLAKDMKRNRERWPYPYNKRAKLINKVVSYVIHQIATEQWPPGMRVGESELVTATMASRSTVRSAISFLIGQGLLAAQPKGAIVPRLEEKELLDLFELRKVIEVAAVKLACAKASQRQIRELMGLVDKMDQSIKDGALLAYSEADREFHQRIAQLSGNSRFENLLPILRLQTIRYRYKSLLLAGESIASLAEHKAIVERLIERDEPGAAQAMELHLVNTSKRWQQADKKIFKWGG